MAERPKLERLSEWLQAEDSAGKFTLAHANLELLLRYCRELEAENKRLADLAEVDLQTREQMLQRQCRK